MRPNYQNGSKKKTFNFLKILSFWDPNGPASQHLCLEGKNSLNQILEQPQKSVPRIAKENDEEIQQVREDYSN